MLSLALCLNIAVMKILWWHRVFCRVPLLEYGPSCNASIGRHANSFWCVGRHRHCSQPDIPVWSLPKPHYSAILFGRKCKRCLIENHQMYITYALWHNLELYWFEPWASTSDMTFNDFWHPIVSIRHINFHTHVHIMTLNMYVYITSILVSVKSVGSSFQIMLFNKNPDFQLSKQ